MQEESPDRRVEWAEQRTSLANERNQLAFERTFLAWSRTGLAIVGAGIAIAKLLTFTSSSHQFIAQVTGSALVVLGLVIFLLSFLDYRRTHLRLRISPGYAGSLISVGLITAVLCIVSVVLLVIGLHRD